jgi:hypothetical protein
VKHFRGLSAVLLVLVFLAGSCATPSSPTGGPPDKTGPTIIRTEPETGTTNFTGRSMILHFSEFVERSSLRESIVVEPDIGIEYDLDWGRKSVEIVFSRDIPDLTTLIVTVGTDFQDRNGNAMSKPKKIAVSTGPEIDKGKLFGRVIDAASGQSSSGERILLYREPYDLSQTASYIASTDTAGVFEFSYLREGRYKAFWVNDRNRNKIWDPEQERAQPFGQEFYTLAEASTDTIGVVYTTSVDTTNPSLQGIGLFSSRRMRMRFSENVQLTDSVSITVTDSASNDQWAADPLYLQPNDPYILFGYSRQELLPSNTYKLALEGMTDNANNLVDAVTQTFTGSAQEDTTQQRIIKRNNLSGYYPTDPVKVTYAKPIDEPAIRDSLKVVAGDTLIDAWPNVTIEQNVLTVAPQEQWQDGREYEIRLWDPIIEDYRQFQPQIWHQSQMGELNIMTEDSTAQNIRLRVINEESGINRDTTFTGQVEIDQLPPLEYKVIAYKDENENEIWDFGQVSPYSKPEPYFIQRSVPVKKDLTSDLTILLQN